MKKTKGFTLVEIMLVVVVVGILSAVGIKFSGNKLKNQAIATEAVRILGVVENACRVFAVERGHGPNELKDLTNSGLVSIEDLGGTFFSSEEIDTLVGDESIPLGKNGLQNGCGTVNGMTICKLDTGRYSVSGTYTP